MLGKPSLPALPCPPGGASPERTGPARARQASALWREAAFPARRSRTGELLFRESRGQSAPSTWITEEKRQIFVTIQSHRLSSQVALFSGGFEDSVAMRLFGNPLHGKSENVSTARVCGEAPPLEGTAAGRGTTGAGDKPPPPPP